MKRIRSDPELEKKKIKEGFRYGNMVDGFREMVEYVLEKRRIRV